MSAISVSAVPFSSMKANLEDIRKSITYHPSVWKDHFLSYTPDVTEISAVENERLLKLKEKVKKLLAQTPDDSTIKIELIDAIQRLGVGYHFQKEIGQSLREIHQSQISKDIDDLRVVALHFRLLRKQGYRVPCDVFDKFTNDEGNFKESLKNDVKGLLSLYEASYYGLNGEEIMEKALEFSSSHLKFLAHQITNSSLLRQVNESLETPISKTFIRLGARKFISTYQEDESHNQDLLNFAKLDFNIIQRMHQGEANQLSRWWENLDLANKLDFARDRLMESYLWSVGFNFEPQNKTARIFVSKVLALLTILDDIYDVYGSLDELRSLTHAFESWDITAAAELPPYMRISYEALLGVYAEMEDELTKKGQSYRIQYAIQTMKRLLKLYMKEAEWCYSKYVPTMDEYMSVALESCAYLMLSTTSLVGMGDVVNKNHLDWITNDPPILQASEVLGRLMDDFVGHGKEQKISAVGCYMNEHGCSEMDAYRELSKLVNKAWKDLNEEFMEPRVISAEILSCIVNMCHLLHILYSTGDDGFSNSDTRTKDAIKFVLVDPIN